MRKNVGYDKQTLLEELEDLLEPLTDEAFDAFASLADHKIMSIITWISTSLRVKYKEQ